MLSYISYNCKDNTHNCQSIAQIKKNEKSLKNVWRYGFFAYLCIRNKLELFKIRNYKHLKEKTYDKEIQMLGMRLYS